jgi:NADH-quinone oxidoreductase subunit M
MLSLLVFLPLIGALIVGLMPQSQAKAIKIVAMSATVATLAVTIATVLQYHIGDFHFQMVEKHDWIPSLGISYLLGVDGISLGMVFVTALLGVVAMAFSLYETKQVKAFMLLLLILETSMLGTFVALDLILFYAFFELALFPLAILTLIWGGEQRVRASMRVFLYLFGGSILMLVGMVWLAHLNQLASGVLSFSLLDIQQNVANGTLWTGAMYAQPVIFWAFALAFLIKSPAFPFHTWLIDSYTQAPIGAVLLGVLVKTGTYGLIRFNLTLFPDALPKAAPVILALAVIGIIYGAIVAAVQTDLRRLIAFSSVAHIGFIILGAFSLSYDGIVGSAMGQVNHGIATGALMLLVGFLLLRKHTTDVRQYGGLKAQMPLFATLFLLATVAAIGLPGTNAFVSEFLALMGTFESGFGRLEGLNVWFAVLAASGVILAAVYMLIGYMKVFYGPVTHGDIKRLRDIKPWEAAVTALLLVGIFWGGFHPSSFTAPMESSSNAIRMMSQGVPGAHPIWSDEDMQMDSGLNLTANRRNRRIVLGVAELHPGNEIAPAARGGEVKERP